MFHPFLARYTSHNDLFVHAVNPELEFMSLLRFSISQPHNASVHQAFPFLSELLLCVIGPHYSKVQCTPYPHSSLCLQSFFILLCFLPRGCFFFYITKGQSVN